MPCMYFTDASISCVYNITVSTVHLLADLGTVPQLLHHQLDVTSGPRLMGGEGPEPPGGYNFWFAHLDLAQETTDKQTTADW